MRLMVYRPRFQLLFVAKLSLLCLGIFSFETLYDFSLGNVFVNSMAVKSGEERLKEMEAEMAL